MSDPLVPSGARYGYSDTLGWPDFLPFSLADARLSITGSQFALSFPTRASLIYFATQMLRRVRQIQAGRLQLLGGGGPPPPRDAFEGGGVPPSLSRAPSLRPATVSLTASASLNQL